MCSHQRVSVTSDAAAQRRNHKEFLSKARVRKGFTEAHEALELEYLVAGEMLKARSRAGRTQDAVAERMGTTKAPSPGLSLLANMLPRSQHSSGMPKRLAASCR